MRLIDADALDLDREVDMADDWNTAHEIANLIKYAPTIEAQPVVHGEWLIKEDEACFAMWDYCSVCGFEMGFATSSHYAKFCPNCGAKMDGKAV